MHTKFEEDCFTNEEDTVVLMRITEFFASGFGIVPGITAHAAEAALRYFMECDTRCPTGYPQTQQ